MIFVFGSNKREKNEKLINIASKISEKTLEKIAILFFDSNKREIHMNYSVDEIYLFKNETFDFYNYDNYFNTLNKFLQENKFSIFLCQNSLIEKEIVNSIANRNEIPILNDIVDFKINDEIYCAKNSIEEESLVEYKLDLNKENILVVKNLNFNESSLKEKNQNINIIDVDIKDKGNYEILREIKVKKKSFDDAKIIFSGGRGIADEEAFNNLRQLSKIYNTVAGGSRPMVELGFINSGEQIGQTGNIVSPDVYVAFGISGSIQHLAGMRNSKNIIAINIDKNANIFNFAKYGIIKDAKIILKNIINILSEK